MATAPASLQADWLVPQWAAPPQVRACVTTRQGGESSGPFGTLGGFDGMNLGRGSGDDIAVVMRNRQRLRALLPSEPHWLHQVHGADVVDASARSIAGSAPPRADAVVCTTPGVVGVVMIADCMPVLLASRCGRVVGGAHAGWRGLAAGVIQNTVAAMRDRVPSAELVAWLGPAIGPSAFEVGEEVLVAMAAALPRAEQAFKPHATHGKYHADLFALGRLALAAAGIGDISGGGLCTFSDPARFYSYRRDRVTGRHAALIWIEPRSVA